MMFFVDLYLITKDYVALNRKKLSVNYINVNCRHRESLVAGFVWIDKFWLLRKSLGNRFIFW